MSGRTQENMKTLFIDTTSNKEIIVRLTIDKEIFEEKREIENNRTQIVLPLIHQLLQKHNLSPKDIEKIDVNEGPGSFTGVRVGVSIANAFSYAIKNSKALVEPIYT